MFPYKSYAQNMKFDNILPDEKVLETLLLSMPQLLYIFSIKTFFKGRGDLAVLYNVIRPKK